MGTRVALADAVLVTSATTGTGTYALGSAVTGYFQPADVTPSLGGVRVGYVAVDSLTAPTIREIGEGVLSAGAPWTLTRATIRRTLNAGVAGSSAVNWPVGTRYVYLTPLAANTPVLDTDGWLGILTATPAAPLDVAGQIRATDILVGGLALAPRPTGAGIGVWQALSSPGNTPLTLPAGGTWAYFFVQRMIANNSVGNVGVGVSAGGTTLVAADPARDHLGFAWRVA